MNLAGIHWLTNLHELNWIGMALATVVTFIIGGVWFTILFGKLYALALGRENDPPQKMAPIFILGPLVCSLFSIAASALLVRALGIDNLTDGLLFGGITGLGYLAATTVNTGINPNIPHPLLYGLISGSYFLIFGLVTSVILALV